MFTIISSIVMLALLVAIVADHILWCDNWNTYFNFTGQVPSWPGSGFYITLKLRKADR